MMVKHFESQDSSHTCTSSTSATDRDCGLKMRRLDNVTLIVVLFGPSAISWRALGLFECWSQPLVDIQRPSGKIGNGVIQCKMVRSKHS